VLRLILIFCASSGLLHESAVAQTPVVPWPPLTGLSASSLYTERPSTPFSNRLLASEPRDTVPRQIPPTHWKEGGIVGAVALGAFGVWFGNEICQETDAGSEEGCTARSIVGGAILGGGLGFLIGALIGGQIPKHSPSDAAEPPE
jgi:hypothetical protein